MVATLLRRSSSGDPAPGTRSCSMVAYPSYPIASSARRTPATSTTPCPTGQKIGCASASQNPTPRRQARVHVGGDVLEVHVREPVGVAPGSPRPGRRRRRRGGRCRGRGPGRCGRPPRRSRRRTRGSPRRAGGPPAVGRRARDGGHRVRCLPASSQLVTGRAGRHRRTGPRSAHDGSRPVDDHQHRPAGGGDGPCRRGGLATTRAAFGGVVHVVEDERPDGRQPAGAEGFAQLGRVLGQVPDRPELEGTEPGRWISSSTVVHGGLSGESAKSTPQVTGPVASVTLMMSSREARCWMSAGSGTGKSGPDSGMADGRRPLRRLASQPRRAGC